MFTHFATDDDYVETQIARFSKSIKLVKKFGMNPIFHADNSRISINQNHGLDMVRVGYNLYLMDDKIFSSVVSIRSTVVELVKVKRGELVGYDRRFVAKKNMTVAIIPVGYADGFSIKYIGMNLIINNKPCLVLNVCMDCFMLDVTQIDIKKGDDIMILDHINSLNNYASHAHTSPYEVLLNFSHIRAKLVSVTTKS